MDASPVVEPKLSTALGARLSEDRRRLSRKVWWQQTLLGLWTPPTVFAIALVPYITLVELHTPAYHWAQPVLKVFGLLMVAWFVGLLISRVVMRRLNQLRVQRHEAREILDELDGVLRRHAKSLQPDVRARLVDGAARLNDARLEGDALAIARERTALDDLMGKQLGKLRKQLPALAVRDLVLWILFAVLVRTVLIEPFKIPSGSMIPTLAIGDQIFVNKFIYGVRIPFMNKVPFVIGRLPHRGDVIVFNNPMVPDKDYIKRVVGIPGDLIELRDEVVFINGVEQKRELSAMDHRDWDFNEGQDSWMETTSRMYQENLDGHVHPVLQLASGVRAPKQGPYVVPKDSVFVLGDNRDNSMDSRMNLGGPDYDQVAYVPYGNIKGKAMIVWLSLSHGGFMNGLIGKSGLRTDRLFLPIR